MPKDKPRGLFPGALEMMILRTLVRQPLHGYALVKSIRAASDELLQIEEGSLYPALHRMEQAGWILAKWVTKENGRRARTYEVTAAGKEQLAAEEKRWEAVTSAVNRVLRMA